MFLYFTAIESRGTKSECEMTSAVTSPESGADDMSPVPDETKPRSLSLPLDAEPEIPEGAVWKQKMELESRLGASSTSAYKEPSPPLESKSGVSKKPLDSLSETKIKPSGYRKDASPVPSRRDILEEDEQPCGSAVTQVSLTSKATINISTAKQGNTGVSDIKGAGSSEGKGVVESTETTTTTGEDTTTEAESKVLAYPTEDIPWSVGTVRQQKEAIEKVNASSTDSSRSSSKSPTWSGGESGSLGPETGNLRRTSSCKTPSSSGSPEGEVCTVGRSASLKESSHGRTELKVSLSQPAGAPVHVAHKELKLSKSSTAQGQPSKPTASKIPAPLEAELEKWSSKKEVLIVEAPKTETKKSEDSESAEKLLKSNIKPVEEKTVRDLVGIFDQTKKSPSDDPSEADLPGEPQPICRSKSVSSRPGSEPQEKTKLDRKVSLPVSVSKGANSQGSSLSPSDASSALDKTLSRSPDAKSGSSPGQRSNRIPINLQREPDPEDVPRKSRKLHGKSHPLSKLTAREGSGPGSEKTGRSPNPVYNTM